MFEATPTRAPRVHYGPSYGTRSAAQDGIAALYASGEISEGDQPQVMRYGAGLPGERKRAHFQITLLA